MLIICINDFEKLSNLGWTLLTFVHAMKNGQKMVKFHPKLAYTLIPNHLLAYHEYM